MRVPALPLRPRRLPPSLPPSPTTACPHDARVPAPPRPGPVTLQKLKEYVKGGNEQGVTLPSTNPSLTIFYPAPQGAAFQALYTIEYFVPYEHQVRGTVRYGTALQQVPAGIRGWLLRMDSGSRGRGGENVRGHAKALINSLP